MCLRKPSELKVAEKDIEVVKYLRRSLLDDTTAVSPFRDHLYTFEKVYTVDEDLWGSSRRLAADPFWNSVNYGFHSHVQKLERDKEPVPFEEYSRQHDEWNQLVQMDNAVAFKAVIPAGAEYFEGEDDWGVPGYCSNQIKITQELVL